jgi:hypothetical protein
MITQYPTTINIPLLRQVQRKLDKHYDQFDMGWWVNNLNISFECRTTMCIAGWCGVITGKPAPESDRISATLRHLDQVTEYYAEMLGVSFESAQRLFFVNRWPAEFDKQYTAAWLAHDQPAMVGVANRRIDHFINTLGAE